MCHQKHLLSINRDDLVNYKSFGYELLWSIWTHGLTERLGNLNLGDKTFAEIFCFFLLGFLKSAQ